MPRELESESGSFVRVLDWFYLPASADPAAAVSLFDDIADHYEALIDSRRNRQTISRLIELSILDAESTRPVDILDFGCGPGVSLSVQQALGPIGISFRLTGTDASPAMLELAKRNGLSTLPLESLHTHPPRFDAVIASYVLHLGVDVQALRGIAECLKPGGVFLGNYFHATRAGLDHVSNVLSKLGGRLDVLDGTPEGGPVLRLRR